MLSWTKVSDRKRENGKRGGEGERREWEGGTERVREGGERKGKVGKFGGLAYHFSPDLTQTV